MNSCGMSFCRTQLLFRRNGCSKFDERACIGLTDKKQPHCEIDFLENETAFEETYLKILTHFLASNHCIQLYSAPVFCESKTRCTWMERILKIDFLETKANIVYLQKFLTKSSRMSNLFENSNEWMTMFVMKLFTHWQKDTLKLQLQ